MNHASNNLGIQNDSKFTTDALNPIERLWAVMHQCVTHNRRYPTQKQFADAILKFFRETLPNEWKTFRSQVSDNFRIVTHEKFRLLE
ncbi:hypothetical protein [Tateyamaria sp.]|uniref:hypothetical protein n=1 Tax=Tateyamaria sp. TaxID=1929288 RepID=UPI003B21B196